MATVFAVGIVLAVAVLLFLSLLLRRCLVDGRVCTSAAQLHGKTVVITGACRGLGRETALQLARRHARIIIADVDAAGGPRTVAEIQKETGNACIAFRYLDLTSLTSVRACATQILQEEARIDVLINNAGVMGGPHRKTEDGIEFHFAVNYVGHFLLTQLLLERLKEAPAGRIVNTASWSYKLASPLNFRDLQMDRSYNRRDAYYRSKLAIVMFTRSLSRRLSGSRVTVNSVNPGNTRTFLGFDGVGVPGWGILFRIISLLFFKSVRQGTQTTLHAVLAEELEGVSGLHLSNCSIEPLKTAAARDATAAEKLWRLTLEMVGLDSEETHGPPEDL